MCQVLIIFVTVLNINFPVTMTNLIAKNIEKNIIIYKPTKVLSSNELRKPSILYIISQLSKYTGYCIPRHSTFLLLSYYKMVN